MSKHCQFNRRYKKLRFYLASFLHQQLYPRALKLRYQQRCYKLLEDPQVALRVFKRVNYYCKINASFELIEESSIPQCHHILYKTCKNKIFSLDCSSAYRIDCARYLSFFSQSLCCHFLPGDISEIPQVPALLKSRPITQDHSNTYSCLLKLNAIRHFNFINDTLAFSSKISKIVWRGAAYQPQRKFFLRTFSDHYLMNVGQVNQVGTKTYKSEMSISEQLKYKFILCIEGNDVASSLKWVMSSQSLCFMTKPKYETWFMEATLVPGVHYVEVKDDYSDLEEKIIYYSNHLDEAEIIVQRASLYCQQFMNKSEEDLINFLVLEKFFHFSGQIDSAYVDYFTQ